MKNLNNFRKKIDHLDDQLLKTLIERAQLAQKIGRVKSELGGEIYSSAREREILNRLIQKKSNPLSGEDVESIFQEIFNACRSVQKKLKIAYLGPEATFTHQIAIKHFGKSANMVSQKSISDVFVEVEKSRADYGVVPIENSTEGVVNHTLDMFMESDLVICAEREEPISHQLLTVSGKYSKIKSLYSHPQALAQCRKWIESHVPKAEIHESASTADAALQASLDGSSGAIASPLAAKIYHLKIAAPGIEDFQDNYTRFLVIGKNSSSATGKDKTSLMFSVKDKVGALNDILMIFKNNKVNLTKIESRPTKKKAWEYIFFVDFLGHYTDKVVEKTVSELKKSSLYLKLLGSYPLSN